MQVIQAVYEKDKKCLDADVKAYNTKEELNGDTVFLYPFGLCVNFIKYDTNKDVKLMIYDYNKIYSFQNMFVFITDPAMITFSSICQRSHKGTKLFGLKKGFSTFYDVEVEVRDSDNPAERNFCTLSSYSECVDQQTQEIFSEVILNIIF